MRIGWMLAAGAMLLGACQQRHDLAVSDAWVRLPAVTGRPAAAYFTLHGGPTDTALTRISTPAAIRSELHRSVSQGGVMTMQPIASERLPAGATVVFAPGGNHAMLFDVNPSAKPGGTIVLTLEFADGRSLPATAKVVAAGDPAPGA